MENTEETLILTVGRFREADMWVRLFSSSRGAFTAFAFGGSRSRRRFCGCLDTLNRVRFRIGSDKTGSYLCLKEGVLIKAPSRLRQDWARLGVAVNCLKFLEALPIGPEGAAAAYALCSETLDTLEDAEEISPLFPLLFRAKLAFQQGFAPGLDSCAWCGATVREAEEACFLVEEGGVACVACPEEGQGPRVRVGRDGLDALAFVHATGPACWPAMPLSSEARRECARIVDGFVQYHLGLAWDRGSFRKI